MDWGDGVEVLSGGYLSISLSLSLSSSISIFVLTNIRSMNVFVILCSLFLWCLYELEQCVKASVEFLTWIEDREVEVLPGGSIYLYLSIYLSIGTYRILKYGVLLWSGTLVSLLQKIFCTAFHFGAPRRLAWLPVSFIRGRAPGPATLPRRALKKTASVNRGGHPNATV